MVNYIYGHWTSYKQDMNRTNQYSTGRINRCHYHKNRARLAKSYMKRKHECTPFPSEVTDCLESSFSERMLATELTCLVPLSLILIPYDVKIAHFTSYIGLPAQAPHFRNACSSTTSPVRNPLKKATPTC